MPLNSKQKQMLEKHAKHHSPQHLKSMRMHMMNGKSFKQAHKAALKKYGK